ncbi:MAG: DUF2333 family protein [Candidatus Magnetomorum sp.]|nr:DUF2333 family protein [Candidatus Magnetomorum sp.]
MYQFTCRWSGSVCKKYLSTVLAGLLIGLFFMQAYDCQAKEKVRTDNFVSGEQDAVHSSHENQTSQKEDALPILQTDTAPILPAEVLTKPKKIIPDNDNSEIQPDPKTVSPCPKNKKDLQKKSVSPKIPEKKVVQPKIRGRAFVEGITMPLSYELNERFWGWRPNDIINVTDNINNLQLGILETSRRAVVVLVNRISRTGSNDTIDENIENAMNWLMIKARQYWFPAPESKYNQAIDELNQYIERLERGRASFYIRTDNLIPLLEQFEDLLGGCDKSLTIKEDADGPIGSSKADNYFYYAQGVALAMGSIYRGVRKDFLITLDSVQGTEILDEAIAACDDARDISPLIVTEGSLSSIFANHRANIDQPINRIRFYTNVLIRTLKGY